MKMAIIGGTHGNEPVGIEVIKYLENNRPANCIHEFECVLGNPLAYERGLRFVDTDLNRSYGKNGVRTGYEGEQSQKIEEQVAGNFDFVIDLHTTTSNMGLTILLTNENELSRKAAVYLQKQMPEIKIIECARINEECPYTNNLVPAGITLEVGPVANNVLDAELILATNKMVTALLEWDFNESYDLSTVEHYKSFDEYKFPETGTWYVHPKLERADFVELNPGDPVFINMEGEVLGFDFPESIYPFFINEAAYQNDRLVMTMSRKRSGF